MIKAMFKTRKQRLYLFLTILSVLFCSWCRFSYAASDSSFDYEIKFLAKDLAFSEDNGYTVIKLKDCQLSREIANPQLPYKVLHIALEEGKELEKIDIISDVKELLPGTFTVYPSQESVRYGEKRIFTQPNPAVYASSQPYPKERVEIKAEGNLSGIKIATIHLYPLEYLPQQKLLFLHTQIKLKLLLRDKKPATNVLSLEPAKINNIGSFARNEFLKKAVINPAVIEQQTRSTANKALSANASDYLIITSQALKNSGVFQPLIDSKEARGLRVEVACVEDIYAVIPGRDKQEKIRNFIKQKYSDNGITWVLLGGDTNIVPARVVLPEGNDEVASDMYYSDLDGDWDANANKRFGENADNLDLYPDVFVGRAPIENESEARVFVNKILTYETNVHNYSDKVLLLGGNFPQNSADINDFIANEYIPSTCKVTKYYLKDIQDYRELTINAINEGQHIINILGHGTIASFEAGWGLHIQTGNIDALSNASTPAVLVAIAPCHPADMNSDCLAEHWITNPNGGGAAFIGNSGYGLSPESSDYLPQSFFESLFRKGINRIGQTLVDSKLAFIEDARRFSDIQYAMLELNLLGDPEMAIQVDGEADLNIASPKNTGYLHGAVDIYGTAFLKQGFQRYELSYASLDNPEKSTFIYSSDVPVDNSLLTKDGAWDTTQCPDGKYLLTLKIITQEGKIIECRNKFEVIVDNVNQPPEFIRLINRGVVINKLLEFTVQAVDPDDPVTEWGQLRFSADNLPTGAQFNPETRVFSWKPSETERGIYHVDFTVQDRKYTVTKTITIGTAEVEEIQITPYQPTAIGPTDPAIYEDKVVWSDRRNGSDYGIYMYDFSTKEETAICTGLKSSGYSLIGQNKFSWCELTVDNKEQSFIYDLPIGQTLPYEKGMEKEFRVWIEHDWDNNTNEIHLYDFSLQQDKIIDILPHLVYISSLMISKDKIIWMDNRNGHNIYVYDIASGQEKQITTATASPVCREYNEFPAIYEDKIVWRNKLIWNDLQRPAPRPQITIYMYDLLLNKKTQISDNLISPSHPAIHEDKIAWSIWDNGHADIFIYDLSTGMETQITDDVTNSCNLRIYGNKIVWGDRRETPDGREVALRAAIFKFHPGMILGDVNADGKITMRDAQLVYQIANNKITFTEEEKQRADVDHNGQVTMRDMRLILYAALGKIKLGE